MAYKLLIDRMFKKTVRGNNFVMVAVFRVSDGVTADADLVIQIMQSMELDATTLDCDDILIVDLKEKLKTMIDKKNQDDADEAALATKKEKLISDLTTEGYIK